MHRVLTFYGTEPANKLLSAKALQSWRDHAWRLHDFMYTSDKIAFWNYSDFADPISFSRNSVIFPGSSG
jgi:hypothetical protein